MRIINNQETEFYGQLIDIVQDKLEEHSCKDIIKGKEYEDLKKTFIDTLKDWEQKINLEIKTPTGTLMTGVFSDGENNQAYITYSQNNAPANEIDLMMAEQHNDKHIRLYNYEDPYDEDYTRKYTMNTESIEKALKE